MAWLIPLREFHEILFVLNVGSVMPFPLVPKVTYMETLMGGAGEAPREVVTVTTVVAEAPMVVTIEGGDRIIIITITVAIVAVAALVVKVMVETTQGAETTLLTKREGGRDTETVPQATTTIDSMAGWIFPAAGTTWTKPAAHHRGATPITRPAPTTTLRVVEQFPPNPITNLSHFLSNSAGI